MTRNISLIALTAVTLGFAHPAVAQSSDGTDVNNDPVNQTDDVQGGTTMGNTESDGADVNNQNVNQAEDTSSGVIVQGAGLDTNVDINGNPVRANRADVGEDMSISVVRSTELQEDYMVNAMNNSNVTVLQTGVAANPYIVAQLEAAGYSVDDVVGTYWDDGSFYVIVR